MKRNIQANIKKEMSSSKTLLQVVQAAGGFDSKSLVVGPKQT